MAEGGVNDESNSTIFEFDSQGWETRSVADLSVTGSEGPSHRNEESQVHTAAEKSGTAERAQKKCAVCCDNNNG